MKTILVVDDEASMRKSIVVALNAKGYKTIEAEDGMEGLSLAAARFSHNKAAYFIQELYRVGCPSAEPKQTRHQEITVPTKAVRNKVAGHPVLGGAFEATPTNPLLLTGKLLHFCLVRVIVIGVYLMLV